MTVILHCERCGGNIRPYKYCGYRICDIDGERLTSNYRDVIKENGCSFFTLRSIPRKATPLGFKPIGIGDAEVQEMYSVPADVQELVTVGYGGSEKKVRKDTGKIIYFDEYVGNHCMIQEKVV